MRVRLHKRGKYSYTLSIPSKIAEALSLAPGMRVTVSCEEGYIDVTFCNGDEGRKIFVLGRCDIQDGQCETLGFTIPKRQLEKYGYVEGEELHPRIIEVTDSGFKIRYFREGLKRSGSHTQSVPCV